jgi:hypothetical protein
VKEIKDKKFCKIVVYEVKNSETKNSGEICLFLDGWKILIPSFICDILFMPKLLNYARKKYKDDGLQPISK